MGLSTDPTTAKRAIDDAIWGSCRYCRGIYTINQNKLLRRHGDCEQDCPEEILVFMEGGVEYFRVDDLAEIAAKGMR